MKRPIVLATQAAPSDIFATTERLPEFSPVAAEGEFDEANTIFIGEHLHSLPVTNSACRLWRLPQTSALGSVFPRSTLEHMKTHLHP